MNSDVRVLRLEEAENLHMSSGRERKRKTLNIIIKQLIEIIGLFRNHCITKGP